MKRPFLFRALNTEERIEACSGGLSLSGRAEREERAAERLVWWESQLKGDRKALFERRTREFGLSAETVIDLIGASDIELADRGTPVPGWMTTLDEVLNQMEAGTAVFPSAPIDSLGMISFTWPWLGWASSRLKSSVARAAAGNPACAGLLEANILQQLVERYSAIAQRTLALEFNVADVREELRGESASERLRDFCARLSRPAAILNLAQEYPVVARLLTQETEAFAEFAAHVLDSYAADAQELGALARAEGPAGALTSLEMGAGDRHCGGQTVCILTDEAGRRYVYKPRSLRMDSLFSELLDLLESHGLALPLRTARVLERGDYGWSEFIAHEVCDDRAGVERFYTRIGELLAVIFCLYGTDIHYENVIAAGEHPIILDLECLFCQPRKDDGNTAGAILTEAYAHTVLFTHMLPGRPIGGADGVELSALSTGGRQPAPFENLVFDQDHNHQMRVTRRRTSLPSFHNSPLREDSRWSPTDFEDMIVSGWASATRAFVAAREQLFDSPLWREVEHCTARYVPVPTPKYSRILRESLHPNLLRNAVDRDAVLDELWTVTPFGRLSPQFVRSARRSLWQTDIPKFVTRADSKTIWGSHGEAIEPEFHSPIAPSVRERLTAISPHQENHIWTIRQSLRCVAPAGRVEAALGTAWDAVRDFASRPIEEACLRLGREIGDYILRVAYRSEGSIFFADTLEAFSKEKRVHFAGVQDPVLYNGLSGMFLFFHYLGKVCKETVYATAAREILRSVERAIRARGSLALGAGGYCGNGSILYALAHNDAPGPAEIVLDAARRTSEATTQFDLCNGCAGTICSLLAFDSRFPRADTLSTAVRMGDRLLAGAVETPHGLGWHGLGNSVPVTGFAHGSTGIAYALFLLAHHSGEQRFGAAAVRALEYDRHAYSAAHENWLDLRDWASNRDSVYWCYGAPGVALSRIAIGGLGYADEMFEGELDVAVRRTLRHNPDNHTVCHGAFGNWEILNTAAQRLRNPQLQELSDAYIRSVVERVAAGGFRFDSAAETLNLMLGLAGVGYTLVRRACPEQTPCFLLLEPPGAIANVATPLVLTGNCA